VPRGDAALRCDGLDARLAGFEQADGAAREAAGGRLEGLVGAKGERAGDSIERFGQAAGGEELERQVRAGAAPEVLEGDDAIGQESSARVVSSRGPPALRSSARRELGLARTAARAIS
jgi:hypothetical protein